MQFRQIVQSWRSFEWRPEDLDGTLVNWPPENGHHEVCYFDLVEAV